MVIITELDVNFVLTIGKECQIIEYYGLYGGRPMWVTSYTISGYVIPQHCLALVGIPSDGVDNWI